MKQLFLVYYKKDPTFTVDENLTQKNFGETHVLLTPIQAEDKNDVYIAFQAENWSPNGEARDLLKRLGLHHTSMSIGDCIYQVETKQLWEVDRVGWRLVPEDVPTKKAPEVDSLLTEIAGISRQDAMKQGICTWCKNPVGEFKDELSRKEYRISGFCQKCQDETFGE